MRPQNIKNFHFFVGRLPWPISKIFRGFYAPVYPTWVFKIWRDSLHRLLSYCWETARRSIRPIFFRAPCRKNYALHRKMDDYFLMATVSSITTQSLGKIALRAPAVDAETWYLYVFFVILSRSEAGALFVRGWQFEQVLCRGLLLDFDVAYIVFFSIDCPFKCTTHCLFLLLVGATSFAQLRSKISKSPKIGGKVCGHHFV